MERQLHHDQVTAQFGANAEHYLTSQVHAGGKDLDLLRAMMQGQGTASVLDMGCGGGHVSYTVAPYVQEVIAFDLSQEMLNVVHGEAKTRNFSNIKTVLGNIEALPFANASFDFVISRFSAHHWLDVLAGLRQAHRVLKTTGRAIFIDVISPGLPKLDTHLQAIEILRDLSHVRDYTAREWHEALLISQWKVLKKVTLRLRLDFFSWIKRMDTPENRVNALVDLQQAATDETKNYFEIAEDYSFTVDVGIFEAIKI